MNVYMKRHADNTVHILVPFVDARGSGALVTYLSARCRYMGTYQQAYRWEVPADFPGHRPLEEVTHYLEGYGCIIKPWEG